jgi:probable rRNA maturation factor
MSGRPRNAAAVAITRPAIRPGKAARPRRTPSPRRHPLTVDIVVASARWRRRPGIGRLLRRAVAAAAGATSATGELAVVLSDDPAVRRLNRDWRRKDTATNVLAFATAPAANGACRLLGDIVIAYRTTAREARAEHKPFAHHVAHLAVHGFLHLVGYDHETSDQARTMEALEIVILSRLAVPDPYAVRGAGPART